MEYLPHHRGTDSPSVDLQHRHLFHFLRTRDLMDSHHNRPGKRPIQPNFATLLSTRRHLCCEKYLSVNENSNENPEHEI